ncbi:Carboxypeptidase regulatory-like domain-containing protein [Mesorhizobium albiziae]|uniref:Carboxypeptidase regulatory-like domain-containing protein n=1 Tax=Neomesorhizobium albiziae TaxID=335020 RepID=A0A1I4FHF9_9HYPH|nr:CAP domain-containing protein [Mesorhizobium albiziae]GLS29186.1 hypothetical protein GCM10007937_08930 [Mesorhizobium albiziae]SFL17358.1 Carboxypeptidase regulatory-like domain-containing protein [Mesorhizobium albiziae]
MPQHSANEQYLLELINAERAKAGVQPLAFDNDLSEAAEGHSKWMLAADVFSHNGSGGSSSTARMKAAGYTLQGSWATGENIAWATTRTPTGYQDELKLLHTNLMNSSGHRANLLNPNFREVGLGFEVGDYRGRSSAMLTEDFGKTGTDLFLTGVAFDDRDNDRFYDLGEGLGGITVTAKNASGQLFKTTTSAAGGYDLVLKPGTYTVTFSGTGIATSTQTATIGSTNVKKDLVDPVMTSGTLSAAATADDSGADSGAAPTPAPVEVTDGGDKSSNTWLAEFFKRGGDWDNVRSDRQAGQTLADNDSVDAPAAMHDANLDLAFRDDHLRFQPSVEAAANAEDFHDQFQGWFAQLGDGAAEAALAYHQVDVPVPTDMADAATANILAQLAAGTAGAHSDLLI